MPVTVEEFEGTFSRVVCTFRVSRGEKNVLKHHKFRLNPYQYPGIPLLEVSCRLKLCRDSISDELIQSVISADNDVAKTKYEVSLHLAQANPTPEECDVGSIQVVNNDLENANQLRPSRIWANVNEGGDFYLYLTESSCSAVVGKWDSEKFVVDLLHNCKRSLVNRLKLTLSCVMWIEFETFGEGVRSLVKNISDMFTLQTNCDVQFCFGDSRRIGGHMNIIAARSPVFAAMFQHKMIESTTGIVQIEDFDVDVFKELLHFFYSGRISKLLNEDLALTLLSAADKYGIEDLKNLCVNYILQIMTVNSVIKHLVCAHLHSADILKEAALDFIACNGKQITNLPDWEDLTITYPMLSVLAIRRILE